jgi:hypothetical protein
MADRSFTTGYSDSPITKIEYWYDKNIKLYTFVCYDESGNQTEPADYCTKWDLVDKKNTLKDEKGITPKRWKDER